MKQDAGSPNDSTETGYVNHIIDDGARYHVLSWFCYKGIGFTKCSEPRCEINRHFNEFEERVEKLNDF